MLNNEHLNVGITTEIIIDIFILELFQTYTKQKQKMRTEKLLTRYICEYTKYFHEVWYEDRSVDGFIVNKMDI